jgi:hypothetical protein
MGEDVKEANNALVPAALTPALLGSAQSFREWILSIPSYFERAAPVGPEKVWETRFSRICLVLKMLGVPDNHLQTALTTLLVLNSAHLGNPLALELIDNEEKSGGNLLRRCLTLIPETFQVEFADISKDFLILQKKEFKGKVIIASDSPKYKKVAEDLNSLLESQRVKLKHTSGGKYGITTQPILVAGPVGFVSIAQDSESTVLNRPSFLKIHFNSGQSVVDPRMVFNPQAATEEQNNRFKLFLAKFKNGFKRLQFQPVQIPFENVIADHLMQTKNSPKLEAFLKALRIITIINHSPDELDEERLSKDCGVDMKIVKSALGTVNIQQPLVASKVDYYIFWRLMSELIKNENEDVFLTERQKRIFEVIKAYNAACFGSTFKSFPMSDYEKLTTIENYSDAWASLDKIFEAVNKDGGEKIPNMQTVGRELRELNEKKLITDENIPNSKNKPGYYVTTFENRDTVPLPDPSEIEAPALGKEKIKIRNPITGEIDEI